MTLWHGENWNSSGTTILVELWWYYIKVTWNLLYRYVPSDIIFYGHCVVCCIINMIWCSMISGWFMTFKKLAPVFSYPIGLSTVLPIEFNVHSFGWIMLSFLITCVFCLGWVGLWGFLWWAPSAKGKDHHGVSSGWSSVWHRSNTGLSSTQYEQIPIILGIWPFWLTPFFFRSITFWRAYG